MEDVSHREIYERLIKVEDKVDELDKHTRGMVDAFEAAAGAFAVLNLLANIVKPIIVVGAFFGAIWLAVQNKLHT